MSLSFKSRNLPYYLLILSLFISSFILQYVIFFVVLIWMVSADRLRFRSTFFVAAPMLIIGWALLSYLINLYTGLADKYSILFWLMSYLPPFLLMWLILFDTRPTEFRDLYRFYKIFVYAESFLLIKDVVVHRTFVVGDPATGTVGDANLVAYHIAVVLIFEIIRVLDLYQVNGASIKSLLRPIIEILYFLVVFLIPESTANLGLLIILAGFIFVNYMISRHLNIKALVVLIVLSIIAFFVMKDGFVYRRLEDAVSSMNAARIENDPNVFKLKLYGNIFSMKVIPPALILTGTGPSTFTSRSSVIRIPEDRVNFFPYPLPYFKNDLFENWISSEYRKWRASGESYGNFASPQATAISVTVELGLVGLFLFGFFFAGIFHSLRRLRTDPSYLSRFGIYFSVFFVMSLFHLNFWEYPIVAFTYILFISLILKPSRPQETGPVTKI